MSKKPAPDCWQPSATGSEGNCHRFELSPGGRVRLDIDALEVRNGEWFESPIVTDLASGTQVFSLPYPWDCFAEWAGPELLRLHLGKARGHGRVAVLVDVPDDTVTLERTGEVVPFAKAERAIERDLAAYLASLPPPPPPPPAPPKTLRDRLPRPAAGWKNWFLMMLIALVFYAMLLGYLFWEQGRLPAALRTMLNLD